MQKLFWVCVPANVYAGKYFDYRIAPVAVVARSSKDACNRVNRYKEEVLTHLHARKVGISSGRKGRYLIPHTEPPSKNVFFKDEYQTRPLEGGNSAALCPDGKFHRIECIDGTSVVLKVVI